MSAPTTSTGDAMDRHDVRLATGPPEELAPYNRAGVLGPADVHAAATLCRLAGEDRPAVLLGAALAVRAPQHGHVCVDLTRVAETITGHDDAPVAVTDLEWPATTTWHDALASSPLVSVRPPGTPEIDPSRDRPLSLVENRLYLDRYWRYERRVAEVLRRRATRTRDDVDPAAVREALDRLLPPGSDRPDRQRLAVATGVLRDLTVVAGGPGTGKTHTVARLLALVHELHPAGRPRVAVAAPTGKAADRLTAALRDAASALDTTPAVRTALRELEASTLHRLLGWRPGSHTRFWHDRERKLPYDLVVVDETSMVDLALMAKLVAALRPSSRLVLVGDPDQLESVEAGAVLGDIVGPAGRRLRMGEAMRDSLAAATGEPLDDVAPARADGIDDALVVLGAVHRYDADSGIARLAAAIHDGDADAATTVLEQRPPGLSWVETTVEDGSDEALAAVRSRVSAAHRDVLAAARTGAAADALAALDRLRVLCAHRHGPVGVGGWVPRVQRWLAADLDDFEPADRFYVGRPVLVTRNDPRLRLFNGDVGVVVRRGEAVVVAFRGRDGVRAVAPSRLSDIETVHAMTIHKSQGSQFEAVVVVLPDESSPILTRELLYTAVTRARRSVTLVGPAASLRAGIDRRIARASGLRESLWGR